MKKKILFIDRDGTVIKEPPVDFQVDSLEKLEFVPGAIGALSALARRTDYRMVMVTNQDGLGTAAFPVDDFIPPHERMLSTLRGEGVEFDEVLIDDSFPQDNSPRRKPRTGMVEKYMNETLDYENSYVIGDRMTDMQLAVNMGVKGILLGGEKPEGVVPEGVLFCGTWERALQVIKNGARRAEIHRVTGETDVLVSLDLNGPARGDISTGIGFFDHMLDQIARHGGVSLRIKVKGDLNVDEHHTVEDTGIALGQAFAQALGSKKGIERYGFALPMDESSAQVLLDFGGRAHLEWSAVFSREYVGDFPTEMTRHFFGSFCQGAQANVHVAASGENTHHQIEGIFKAFARAVKCAVRQTGTDVPSSKGVL